MIKDSRGFTLIELMVVVLIISIFAAIAYPSYNQYILRKDLAVVQKEALRLSNELEKYKAKNFSYKGFNPVFAYTGYDGTTGELLLPVGSDATSAKYMLKLVDLESRQPLTVAFDADGKETSTSEAVSGLGWAIRAIRLTDVNGSLKQPNNYDILLTSEGVKCKTRYSGEVDAFVSCGDYKEEW